MLTITSYFGFLLAALTITPALFIGSSFFLSVFLMQIDSI